MFSTENKCQLLVKPTRAFTDLRGYQSPDKILKELSQTVATAFNKHDLYHDIGFQVCYIEMICYGYIKNLHKVSFSDCDEYKIHLEKVELVYKYINEVYRPFIESLLIDIFGTGYAHIYSLLVPELEKNEPSDINYTEVLSSILKDYQNNQEKFEYYEKNVIPRISA